MMNNESAEGKLHQRDSVIRSKWEGTTRWSLRDEQTPARLKTTTRGRSQHNRHLGVDEAVDAVVAPPRRDAPERVERLVDPLGAPREEDKVAAVRRSHPERTPPRAPPHGRDGSSHQRRSGRRRLSRPSPRSSIIRSAHVVRPGARWSCSKLRTCDDVARRRAASRERRGASGGAAAASLDHARQRRATATTHVNGTTAHSSRTKRRRARSERRTERWRGALASCEERGVVAPLNRDKDEDFPRAIGWSGFEPPPKAMTTNQIGSTASSSSRVRADLEPLCGGLVVYAQNHRDELEERKNRFGGRGIGWSFPNQPDQPLARDSK